MPFAMTRAIAITRSDLELPAVLDDQVAVSIPDVPGVLEFDRGRRHDTARHAQDVRHGFMRQLKRVRAGAIADDEQPATEALGR